MKHFIPSIFLILVFIAPLSRAEEGIEKVAHKVEMELKPLDEEMKGDVIRYEIPDLHRKSINAPNFTRLLTSILAHGAKVTFKFEREKVIDDDFKEVQGIGTYVVSVEPKIFKTGDTIVIGVNNASLGN